MKKTAKLIAWSFYDFGNSAFSAIIETFILPPFFVKVIYGSEKGEQMWGLTLGLTGIIIALAGPVVGAIADQGGNLRRGLTICSLLSVICCFLLGVNLSIISTLLLFSLASIGSEFAYIFYNSMLPRFATEKEIGKWSGLGWGFGYIGGVFSLTFALALLYFSFSVPTTFVMTGIWYLIFALPLLCIAPGGKMRISFGEAIRKALLQLKHSFSKLVQQKKLLRFFIARMFFIDGLTTLFAFGGIYAASIYGMQEEEVVKFAIALNVTAGIGAMVFGRLDDLFGPLKVMKVSLIALLFGMLGGLFAVTPLQFWLAGMFIGLFVGPLQASSRSYVAKNAPTEWMSEMFGFFAFSGKATAFMGPLLLSLVLALSGSLTALSLLFFWWGFSCCPPQRVLNDE